MSISFAATPQSKEAQQARAYTDPSRGAPPSRRSGANAPYIDKDHWNKVFTEPEYFDSIAKQKGMAEGAKVSLFGDDYVYRQAMIGYMSDTRNVPIDDMRKVFDVEKDAFAQKNLGKKTASAREMFDWHKAKYERENEKQAAARQILNNVAQRAMTNFATGGDTPFVETVAKDIDAAGDMFTDEEKSRLWQMAEENDIKLRATQMRFAPEAKFIFDALRQTTGEGAGFGAPDMRDMATRFAKLPDNQRKAIYELAGSFAQLNQTDKGFWYQMAESLGRGASDIVERVPRNIKEQALRNDLRLLEGDQPVFAGTGVQGTAYSAFGTTPLTPEEREQAAEKVRGELGIFKVERELRDLAERVIDPIKTVTVLPEIVEEGLYGAARSIPYTATAAVPYIGTPAVAGALYSSNYDRIMLEYPDIDPDKAALIAAISAPIEAGLERMKVNTIMGRLPFFGGLVKRFQHPNQRNITRIAIGGAGVLAEQNAQEILQNATFPFVQMIGSVLDKDIPEYNLDLASMPRDLAVQFVALLPLSLMGVGALSYREISRGEQYLRSKDNLEKAGYSEEQIDRITGAATSDEAQSILREESKKRDPEKVKAAAQRIVDESIALREKVNPAALPRLERQGADYVVLSPEGKELARSTDQTAAEQALVSARRETVQREMRDVHTGINEAVEFIEKVNEARQRGEDIAKVIRDEAPRTLLTDYEANPTQENLDRLFETVRAFGQDINEPAELANFPVTGSNQGALREGIWRSIIRINEGADGTIVMREFAQDNLKRAIAEGRTTMDFVRQQLNDILPQIDSDRMERRLRTETDTDVIEAFSDIAVAYFRGSIREEQIPAGLRGIMRRLAIATRDIFRRAYNLARLRAEGKLDRDFEALLAEAVGVNQQALVDRARERTEQEVGAQQNYSIAGGKARLSQFMQDSQFTALGMVGDSKTSEEIRAVTGWFHHPFDGGLVWEIPDNNAQLKLRKGATRIVSLDGKRLGEVLDHPALYEAYPDLQNIVVYVNNRNRSTGVREAMDGASGKFFRPYTNPYNQEKIPARIVLASDLSKSSALRVLMHEVQHAIQAKEGFPRGSNWREFARDGYSREESLAAYRRTAGEIEARDVEARLNLTPEERQAVAPYSSSEIASGDKDRALVMYYGSSVENYSIAVPSEVDEAAVYDSVLKLAGSRKWDRGRDLKMAMQEAVLSRAQSAGVDVSDMSPETKAYLVRVALRDALFALKQNPNAIGWYDIKTRQALAVMALIHPEIGTDENARFAFTWILAVTSNGLKVDKNFDLAEEVYRGYKKKKVMPTNVGIGTAGKAINNSLKLFNRLSKEWGIDNFRAFTQTTFKVSDISSIDKTLKPSGEFAATEVRGAAIAGPKIGNGFFSNLNGFFDALTMDRWLIRTWGRWTGTLIKAMPEQTTKATERLQKAVEALTSEQASELSAVIGMDIPTATMPDLAQALAKASMDKEIREALNNVSEELRKAGNSLAKYLDGQKEAPSGPAERNNVREIFKSVLDELRATEEYKDLTMADLQAVLWYAEKRLYESAKEDFVDDDETEGYADDEAPDYANAAAKVARDKGVSQARISKSLTDTANVTAGGTRPPNGGSLAAAGGQQGAAGGFTDLQKRLFRGNVAVRTVRRGRGSNAAPSWSYSREGSGDGGGIRVLKKIAVKYTASYKAGRDIRRVFRNNGIEAPRFVELVQDKANAKRFAEIIAERKKSMKHGAAVYVYPVSDYQGMRLFLSEDGTTGFALKSNGDIVSVFSTGGAGHGALELAVAEGGTRLDAFDTILPDYYSSHGFVAVSRLNWDDSQAPDGWDKALYKEFNKGEPDVVFMAHQPSYLGWYSQNDGTVYTDYNDAVDAQDRAVADAATGANISTRNYSISTQSEIDRVQAAMDRLARSPSERISQYAALKERLAAALERNQPIMQSMRGDTLPQDFDRTRLLNDLGFLDYILKVLPPEVRGRVGGYTNLAAIAPVDVYKGDQKVSEAKNPAGAIISAWMREGLNIGQAQKKTELPEGYSTVANTTDERRDKTIANFLIDRLKKIDRELERYYKRDLMERIFDVLDKSRPKAGQSGVKRSTLGAETQKFADIVYHASLLDDEKTPKRLAAIEAEITSIQPKDNSPEAVAESQKLISQLSEEWTIVNTFGDLKSRSSETLASGLEWLQGQLKAGREAWQIKEAARIQENRERAAKVIAFLGKPTDIGRFKNKSTLQRFLQNINAFDLDHKSFEQLAFWLFGDEVSAELSKKMMRAQINEAKAELDNMRLILAALREGAKAAGITRGKALALFKENQPNAVRKLQGRKVRPVKISIELAKKIVRGLADRGSLSNADVQTLADELAALPRDTRKENVTIQQVIFRGEEVRLTMSRGQAMQLWLTWQQTDAQEKMRADGFNDDSFEDLDNLISDPFSQAVLRVTQRIYGSGYALTNPIYARMFGMNMPMVKNYAPARYQSDKDVKDVALDGTALTAGGQPSFAKSRVNHTAKLAPEDALTVLQSHIAQQAHWVAFAEVTREYRSLLANPEVREAIRQRFGQDVLRTADMWGDQMEQRGGNKGREIAWIQNMLGAVIGGQSVSLLGYNLKSLAMQTDNFMRFFLALDSRQIAEAMANPAGLFKAIKKVWKTDIIQTRLEGGATAETRFFFERFVSMFRRGARVSELSMMPMNYSDSAGLSVSGAIVYEAAYKDAIDSGMDERSADQTAKDAVEAMVYRYGQPVLMGQKSNIENSGNAFTKAFFLFMSDPRLKMAIISDSVRGLATGRGDWKAHVRRIVAIEMMAVVAHVLATGFRDLTSDDEDEDLWSMGGFARALLLAPFQGYFLLGSVSDLVLSRLTEAKWFTPTQNPLIRTGETAMRAFNNLDDAFNFDDPDALVKEWTDITRSIAIAPPLAAPAVIMNLVRPLVQGWERMDDDE